MKQIVFISGKGGTGKSTIVASLCQLIQEKMIADCDVDAPNLHILIENSILQREDFFGAREVVIDENLCSKCGKCQEICRFDAVDEAMKIVPMYCEGCGACTIVCPTDAIRLESVKTGHTFISQTDQGTFANALLDIGAEGSGKLVTEVRKKLEQYKNDEKWVLIDGSPGIGCVVIASITGADAVVAVTEPTLSGQSDLERVLSVARHFRIPGFVCINKFDLNLEITAEIESFCQTNAFPVIGKIPFDPSIVKALQEYQTPVAAGNQDVTTELKNMWCKIEDNMI